VQLVLEQRAATRPEHGGCSRSVDAAPVKPTTAMNAAAHPTGGSGRQAKAAAQTVDEKAGEALAARGHHPDGEHPAQKPRSADGSGQPTEQYVRLRVQVRGDRLTVLDSHLVDGPLTAPTTLHGAAVYEVTVGDRLVHAAAIPDLGLEQRSFPKPRGAAGPARAPPHRARDLRVLGADPGRRAHSADDRGGTVAVAPPRRTGLGRHDSYQRERDTCPKVQLLQPQNYCGRDL
jgi:hypothetical protein